MGRLKACCCGTPLQDGCTRIGWFTLIFAILGLAGAAYRMHQLQANKDVAAEQATNALLTLKQQLNSINPGFGDSLGTDAEIREKVQGEIAKQETNAALGLVLNILSIITSICLIIGAKKRNGKLVLVFAIYWALIIIAIIAFTIYFVVSAYQAVAASGGDANTQAAVGIVIWIFVAIFILCCLLYAYFAAVAWSFYKEMQEEGGDRQFTPMTYKA